MSECLAEDCKKHGNNKGYCGKHYQRILRHGSPNIVLREQRSRLDSSKLIKQGEMIYVQLTQGKWAVADSSATTKLENRNWNFSFSTGYAYCQNESMHEIVLGCAPFAHCIDHIDRNKLNNMKSNLRFVTFSENGLNRNTPGCGICFHSTSGKYQAFIQKHRRFIYLGLFESRKTAELVREEALVLLLSIPDLVEFKKTWKLMRKRKADSEKKDE